MTRWRVLVLVLSLAACTKPNPRSCADGTCTDPAFPFCDVGGELEGTPQTCIAVACEPGEFNGCRGDLAITCNAEGTDFELIACERGCEDGLGCRLCEPNETACTNGQVATCDANGAVVASEPCPLGCFETEPRCREIDPSNGLGEFLDLVLNPAAMDLEDAIFQADTGKVLVGGVDQMIPSFLISAVGNGVPARVFVVQSLHLSGATSIGASGDARETPSAGLAFIATGEIHIEGTVTVDPRAGSAVTGCSVGNGSQFVEQSDRVVSSGGGGGGNATDGANGGSVSGTIDPVAAAAKGVASGTAEIVPFRGGCSGGISVRDPNSALYPSGGGALHFASAEKITIDGVIDIAGRQQVEFDQENLYFGGGGGGGSLLFEAPTVLVGLEAKLLAQGGDGGGCDPVTGFCTAGGVGATISSPATAGGNVTAPGPASNNVSSGGGGGGLGRIRINTATGAFTAASSSVIEGAITTGELATK